MKGFMSENIFRPVYRELTDAEKAHVNDIKEFANHLYIPISLMADSREKSLAITKLEEAVMWAVKGITK